MTSQDKLPYTLDELLARLEGIREGNYDTLNFPKAFYTLVLVIKDLSRRLDLKKDWDANE